MDSDEDEQIGVKKTGKKTKGRKKATATKTKANKKSNAASTRGRRVKNQILDSSSEDETVEQAVKKTKLDDSTDQVSFTKLDVDKLTADLPTTSIGAQLFTAPSLSRVPLHESKPLNWSHKINLIGEKSLEQRVHLCDVCKEPILNYGRLLPCKHVFCFDCAIELQNQANGCLRCSERIVRCERSSLNSVYMCNHDKQCKRTYLSQRDLQAHIQHRHVKKEKSNSSSEKSIKLRTFASIKEEYQSSFVSKSSNGHHHYPQPSLQTFRWIRNIQEGQSRKPK